MIQTKKKKKHLLNLNKQGVLTQSVFV